MRIDFLSSGILHERRVEKNSLVEVLSIKKGTALSLEWRKIKRPPDAGIRAMGGQRLGRLREKSTTKVGRPP